ncbi:hypothetical protein TCAL_13430 [Tigriopus californicus]|uniref:C2H2-type domain-containing protein n=1 Tax=Tigriopus californicus TaxID=6832 RepID=A0A553PTE1_TIGCA|nr:neurotrophin receptor-interacting factor homolog [Tigriopus californicus]TRY80949.1 hypothetical protein TCAL_13430 [Tigriopus californicus]|eukprot:TCALIF_13430-PA protein Name:"Protein of unknown function" AED:0.15 eAED:0.15 QI:0/1/0.5/1/1/1/2/13/144
MSPLNKVNNGNDQGGPAQVQVEVGQQQQRVNQPPVVCPNCKKRLSERSALTRHMKIHDNTTKLFKCTVCHKNDQRQKSNWRQHVTTHIGQAIPPDVFAILDHETEAILTGTHGQMKRKIFEKRLTEAEAKQAKKNNKARRSKHE